MKAMETEYYKPHPEKPGYVVYDRGRSAQEVFAEKECFMTQKEKTPPNVRVSFAVSERMKTELDMALRNGISTRANLSAITSTKA
jgi:hypothetical protein